MLLAGLARRARAGGLPSEHLARAALGELAAGAGLGLTSDTRGLRARRLLAEHVARAALSKGRRALAHDLARTFTATCHIVLLCYCGPPVMFTRGPGSPVTLPPL